MATRMKRRLLRYKAKLWGNLVLWYRWLRVGKGKAVAPQGGATGLDRCDIVYINLARRTDRRAHIEAEFARLDLTSFARFEAVENAIGALGCSLSHADVLRHARPEAGRLFMVCEDDCQFIRDRPAIDDLIEAFVADSRLDVLCLAFNALNGVRITDRFRISSDIQTTSCYILKRRAIPLVLEAAKTSAERLAKGEPVELAAIDIVWKGLQAKTFFAVPVHRAAKQIASYSDIEEKPVAYHV